MPRVSRSPVKFVRAALQWGTVGACLVVGIRYARGASLTSVERYCPFGGLETLGALITKRSFSCATGETNLALFLALVALTVVSRKAFCGWVCPVGTLSEAIRAIQNRLQWFRPPWTMSGPADQALRWVRLPILAIILYFTYKTGELVFRGYDPYYILFSAHGHDVKAWSYGILAGILILTAVVPMGWCRYLCPLGGALWPLSRAGILRIRRDGATCTDCGRCDRSCPQSIPVSRERDVVSGECTLCLECIEACPSKSVLALSTPGGFRA